MSLHKPPHGIELGKDSAPVQDSKDEQKSGPEVKTETAESQQGAPAETSAPTPDVPESKEASTSQPPEETKGPTAEPPAPPEEKENPLTFLPPLTEELKEVLGMSRADIITCALALRKVGHEIKQNERDERAHVLHWALGLWSEHGKDWKKVRDQTIEQIVKTH